MPISVLLSDIFDCGALGGSEIFLLLFLNALIDFEEKDLPMNEFFFRAGEILVFVLGDGGTGGGLIVFVEGMLEEGGFGAGLLGIN